MATDTPDQCKESMAAVAAEYLARDAGAWPAGVEALLYGLQYMLIWEASPRFALFPVWEFHGLQE